MCIPTLEQFSELCDRGYLSVKVDGYSKEREKKDELKRQQMLIEVTGCTCREIGWVVNKKSGASYRQAEL